MTDFFFKNKSNLKENGFSISITSLQAINQMELDRQQCNTELSICAHGDLDQ